MLDDQPAPRWESDIHARNWAVRRVRRIGGCLVSGPRALLPPPEVDDFGWLEPDLRLVLRRGRHAESIIIFCDNTVNRDADFLAPVMRRARWDSKLGLPHPVPPWPQVDISLARFEDHYGEVSECIRQVEIALAHAPFVPLGLTPQRDVPQLDIAEERGYIEIECRNGYQTLQWEAFALPAGDTLTDLFFSVMTELPTLVHLIPREGWLEAYNHDPTNDSSHRSWYWDGQAPPAAPGPARE